MFSLLLLGPTVYSSPCSQRLSLLKAGGNLALMPGRSVPHADAERKQLPEEAVPHRLLFCQVSYGQQCCWLGAAGSRGPFQEQPHWCPHLRRYLAGLISVVVLLIIPCLCSRKSWLPYHFVTAAPLSSHVPCASWLVGHRIF